MKSLCVFCSVLFDLRNIQLNKQLPRLKIILNAKNENLVPKIIQNVYTCKKPGCTMYCQVLINILYASRVSRYTKLTVSIVQLLFLVLASSQKIVD